MAKTDITEFVRTARQRLINAIGSTGVPESDLREICHKSAPFGNYKLPVVIFAKDKPVAKFWLSFPQTDDGKKTVKFNVDTFHEISQWLRQNPPQQTSLSSTTESQSSS